MDIFRRRLPPAQSLVVVFAISLFVVHVWQIINMLQLVPAWIIRLEAWELVGVIAYTQVFALLESLIIFVLLVFLVFILPGKLFRDKFVALSALFLIINALWAILIHHNDEILDNGGLRQLLPWLVLYLISLVSSYLLIFRLKQFESALEGFVQRVSVLAFIYFFFDVMSILIVFIRNV